MFKRTLTAAVAAMTLAGATMTTTSRAQAAGIVTSALASRRASAGPTSYGYRPERSYGEGDFRKSPIFAE